MKDKLLVSFFSYINAVSALGFNFSLMYFFSKNDYGMWSIANSTAAIVANLLLFGFPKAYQNLVASGKNLKFELYTSKAIRAIIWAVVFGTIYMFIENELIKKNNVDFHYIIMFICLIIHFVFIEYGAIAAQMGHLKKKIFIMTAHPNVARVLFFFILLLFTGLLQTEANYSLITVTIFLQVILTLGIVYFHIFAQKLKSFRTLLKLPLQHRELKKKRIWFFGSTISIVLSTYLGTVLLGYEGTPKEVADFQIAILLINFCMIIPNAIYVRLLGSRTQESFHNKTINKRSIYLTVSKMALFGTLISLFGYFLLSLLINNVFPSYNLGGFAELVTIILIVTSRFAISYPFALMNAGEMINYKTKIQSFSVIITIVCFYIIPHENLVLCMLIAYFLGDLSRTLLGLLWVNRNFRKSKHA